MQNISNINEYYRKYVSNMHVLTHSTNKSNHWESCKAGKQSLYDNL